jgi:hypothetical protein
MSFALPKHLLDELVAELDTEETVGILLGGSYARGDASSLSDVDLAPFVADGHAVPPKRLLYRDGRLISIAPKTVAGWRMGMARPETAIYTVSSLREARILLDKSGAIAALKREAYAFRWEPLQELANAYVGKLLLLAVEHMHKLVAALVRHDESALCRALEELLYTMPLALAVQRGILIVSGNTYYRQLEEAAGLASGWTYALRQALGARALPADAPQGHSPLEARGIAALRCYRETAVLLWEALSPTQRTVIAETLAMVHASGYSGGTQG